MKENTKFVTHLHDRQRSLPEHQIYPKPIIFKGLNKCLRFLIEFSQSWHIQYTGISTEFSSLPNSFTNPTTLTLH